MYSLVSAGVLACDLVKHPRGAQVADVVDRVLALEPTDLEALAATSGDGLEGDRQAVLQAAREVPQMRTLLRGVGAAVGDAQPDGTEARTIVDALSQTLLGDLDDLLALLLREAPLDDPEVPPAVVQAALDAVSATWVGAAAGPDVLAATERLRRRWDDALPVVPPPLPDGYGGHAPDLRDLLDAIGRLDGAAWSRVDAAHDSKRGGLAWSEAMHLACRAAHDDHRVVAVARGQLAAARALRLSAVSTTPVAGSAAMAVTAAVQATCVLDLLDVETARTLLGTWQAGSGAL
ncbi:MAG: hypothetical protein Q8R60_07130 [Mycobacteriales bacterium]|nr:hypothetical protein [Mycobacteriales bacterium]